jgi:hypothetical protein
MAGPEPYPQEKWTAEQEAAYAEGRKSAQGSRGSASRSGGTTSSGRKRYVRTAEGSKRYKVPIGAEIGTARKGNARAAEAQKDTDSTARYEDLVGQDRDAQAKAMAGLNDDQLQRLSLVAYSFPSSNSDVVRLRIGVAGELRKRGMNVNDFGGLGGGSAPATRTKTKTKSKGAVADPKTTKGIQAAMTKMYGNKQPVRASARKNLSVPQLRQALGAFSKVAPAKRGVVASYLVDQAIELGVPHMLGASVVAASGQAQRVIELAGRWKHGYIPLDSVALASKMKGKTGGKQWWTGGARSGKGSGGSKGRLHDAVGIPKAGDKSAPAKRGGLTNAQTGNRFATKSRVSEAAPKRKPGVSGKPSNLRRSIEAGKQARGSKDRTSVVKSSSKPNERGSKMDLTGSTDTELNIEKRAIEGVAARKQPTKEMRDRYAAIKAELARRKAGTAAPGTGGRTTGETEFEKAAKARVAVEPFPAAANYLEMHGTAKTREKLDKLKTKRDDLKAMRRKTTSVDLEIKGLENVLARDSERKFQAQKSRSRLTPEQQAKRGFTGTGSSGKA